MKIVKNRTKLGPILEREKIKLIGQRYIINNMKKANNIKKFKNTAQNYLWVIRESLGRLYHTSKAPSPKVKFTNNKNWNINFSGFNSGVPIILLSNNNRYMGHIWVNGARSGTRTTGHFQQIQKSVNMNNFLTSYVKNEYKNKTPLPRTRVAPILLNAAEKHLKNLGYNSMSTEWPLGKMMNYMNSHPNIWKKRNLVYTKKIKGNGN